MTFCPSVRVAVFLVWCAVLAHSEIIKIVENSSVCGSTFSVEIGANYTVHVSGNIPGAECTMTFKGQPGEGKCRGMCYRVLKGTVFTHPKASVQITAGSNTETLGPDNQSGAECFDDVEMSVAISHEVGYIYDEKDPGYNGGVVIYNKCGRINSISFDEAVKSIKGFHHGDEFHRKVKSNYVSGILLGFGLSSIFLVLLLITYCYYKHSPNRGASRSVGLPSVSFRKKIKANKTPQRAPEPVTQYKPREPENIELGKVPESKPLLNSANADADYIKPPPVDADNGPTEVITEPAKVSTSSDSLKGDNKENRNTGDQDIKSDGCDTKDDETCKTVE